MDRDSDSLAANKHRKVRGAWISFVGRIAAQLIGAIATVGLGVVVFGPKLASATVPVARAATAQEVLVAKPVRTQQGTVIVLVPLNRYHEVTAEIVDQVSGLLAKDSSLIAGTGVQAETPRWAAANAH